MTDVPDPEVPERATRRRFTAAYKLRVVAEYEAATEPGAKGALLRREGLYSSHIVAWRNARDAGALRGLDRKRGRKPADPREAAPLPPQRTSATHNYFRSAHSSGRHLTVSQWASTL